MTYGMGISCRGEEHQTLLHQKFVDLRRKDLEDRFVRVVFSVFLRLLASSFSNLFLDKISLFRYV